MAGSVNKVILVGNLGRDPEVRSLQNGNKVANLSLATSETWRDRDSGERRERTEWHRVVIFNERLADVAEKYLRKETLPESYPGIENMEFSMTGNFIFTPDSLTVKANGYEGCIFNSDTLSHTQSWYVKNDTLFLMTEPDQAGMTYRVKSQTRKIIELQLMDDIFVTLTK